MRLIINGQQAFGKASIEAVLEKGEDEIVAVYTAPDKEGRPADPIKEFALEKGLPVFQPPNYTDKDVLDEMRSLRADLMVMAYMIIFVPKEARDIPTHGSICFHPSLLPLHRGPSSINWPIIWGATKTGPSVFWPDDGLDEGDILVRRKSKPSRWRARWTCSQSSMLEIRRKRMAMTEAGADVVIAHVGTTIGGTIGVKDAACTIEEAARRTQDIAAAAIASRADVICLSHGGPISTPEDAAYINEHTDVVGFVGASSLERMAFEDSLTELTREFKQIPVKRKP